MKILAIGLVTYFLLGLILASIQMIGVEVKLIKQYKSQYRIDIVDLANLIVCILWASTTWYIIALNESLKEAESEEFDD